MASTAQEARKRADERLLEQNTPGLIERADGACEVLTEDCLSIEWDPIEIPDVEWFKRLFSRHHRKLKSQGGTSELENLILACGSGVSGCHGFIHRHREIAKRTGWIVGSTEDPAAVLWLRRRRWFGDG